MKWAKRTVSIRHSYEDVAVKIAERGTGRAAKFMGALEQVPVAAHAFEADMA